MPWSWVRVSTRTSPKLRDCTGSDDSAARVRQCVTDIVEAAGAEFGRLDFESNGRWARLRFRWDDHVTKRNVMYDLQADNLVDLIDDDERDDLRGRDG
jgi:hypothetical protein